MENATMKIVNVPFGDDVIPATIDENKTVWSVLSQICKNIGLTEKQKDAQVKKVKEDIVLKNGSEKLTLKFEGQVREALCIKNDYLPLWLAKISITPAMQRDNPEATEKLVRYQLEAKDVLAEYFGFKEKEKLTNAVQSTQITTVPDSVASAMMIMQKQTIEAFKIGAEKYMESQKETLKDVLTYCKAVSDQNELLSKAVTERDCRIDHLISIITEHMNVKTNKTVNEEIDEFKEFVLSTDAISWKKDMTNRWDTYYHLTNKNKSMSYCVIYDSMRDNGFNVDEYCARLNKEYKYKGTKHDISKISTCAFYEELHRPFEDAMNQFIDMHLKKNTNPPKTENTKVFKKNKRCKSIEAQSRPEKITAKVYDILVGAGYIAKEQMSNQYFKKLFDGFEQEFCFDLDALVLKVQNEYGVSKCSKSFALANNDEAFSLFEKYLNKVVDDKCL